MNNSNKRSIQDGPVKLRAPKTIAKSLRKEEGEDEGAEKSYDSKSWGSTADSTDEVISLPMGAGTPSKK